jgi:hypothetical protein
MLPSFDQKALNLYTKPDYKVQERRKTKDRRFYVFSNKNQIQITLKKCTCRSTAAAMNF